MTECTDSKWLFSLTWGPTILLLASFEIFLPFPLPSFSLLHIPDQFWGTKCPARIRVLTFGYLDQLYFILKHTQFTLHLYTHTHAWFHCSIRVCTLYCFACTHTRMRGFTAPSVCVHFTASPVHTHACMVSLLHPCVYTLLLHLYSNNRHVPPGGSIPTWTRHIIFSGNE